LKRKKYCQFNFVWQETDLKLNGHHVK